MQGNRSVACSCGEVLVGWDDEELYRMVRGHIDPSHPETHQPIVDDVRGQMVVLQEPTEAAYSSSRARSVLRTMG